MTQREEFDKWCHESLIIPMGFDPVDMMWSAWQAARASRWRSMESAPDDKSVLLMHCEDFICGHWVDGEWYNGTPSAINWVNVPETWHPLPDPPTQEELENLK